MNHFPDYDDDGDCFRWGGSISDLKAFINSVLKLEEESEGETKEDKLHKVFTYKVKDYSVRFYTSTGVLMIHGKNHTVLGESLHNTCEQNKNPTSTLTCNNGGEDEEIRSDDLTVMDKSHSLFINDSSCDENIDTLINSSDEKGQAEPHCDYATVMKELAVLKAEILEIKTKLCIPSEENLETEQLSNELLQCRMEIKNLKMKQKIQAEYTRRLEEVKSSLVTGIKLLMQERNPNTEDVHNSDNSDKHDEQDLNEQHLNSKKKKKKKKNKKKKAAVSEESKNNSSTCNTDSDLGGLVQPRDAKNTVIIGDSIVSKLSGWKMSDKTNRIRIRAFSGSKVEDMSDYIKN